MSKVKRFSLEERYGYQYRKVIYDKDADNDIELNSIYPIIDLLNKYDKQIAELKKQLEEKEKLLQYGMTEIKKLHKRINDIVKRDEKLFKSQPAEIVEKIKEFVDGNAYYYEEEQYAKHIIKYLDDILKEYQK